MSDEQDGAEQLDEDVVLGDDEIWEGDEVEDYPPDRLEGVPFADADVTDESLVERYARSEPEVDEDDIDEADAEDDFT